MISYLGLNLPTLVVCSIVVCLYVAVFNYYKKRSWEGLPPGPPALPLLGSLPFLGQDLREPLREMGKKYGDVFTIYLGRFILK